VSFGVRGSLLVVRGRVLNGFSISGAARQLRLVGTMATDSFADRMLAVGRGGAVEASAAAAERVA
jgi:hypothetical protein